MFSNKVLYLIYEYLKRSNFRCFHEHFCGLAAQNFKNTKIGKKIQYAQINVVLC